MIGLDRINTTSYPQNLINHNILFATGKHTNEVFGQIWISCSSQIQMTDANYFPESRESIRQTLTDCVSAL
jgi:hypothetical protein